MAQHDYVIANGTGAAVRSDLNNALAAIVSQNSGATAPSTTYAYQWWADTTTGLLKLRNAANNAWITLFQLDGEWSTIALENGTAGAPSIYFKDSGTDTGIYSPGTDQVAISTGGTGRLFVNSSGNVGLGTSSPSFAAHISSAKNTSQLFIGITGLSSVDDYAQIGLGSGSTPYGLVRLGFDNPAGITNTYLSFYNNNGSSNVERLRIDSSGRVGIGNTAPSDMLHIGTTSAGGNIRLVSSSYGNNGLLWFFGTDGNQKLQILTGSNKGIVYTPASIDFAFEVGNSEKARLTSDGKFLVGTTTGYGGIHSYSSTFAPSNSNWTKAALVGSGGYGGGLALIDGSAGYSVRAESSGANFYIQYHSSLAAGGSGGVFLASGAGSWSSVSDEREKVDLSPIENGLTKIQALRAVIGAYKWAPEKKHPFLIAQDVQSVLPEAVSISNPTAPEEEQRLGMSYTDVVPLLVQALKEAAEKIETLEAKVAALEAA